MMRRVLVVENEVEIQDVICSILELAECKCEVVRAENGVTALEQLTNATPAPDLIFLDLMMPEMDGVSFVREVRKRNLYTNIPIIVISGDMGVREQVSNLNMDVFIEKPFSVNEVLDIVNALIAEPVHA